MKELFKDGKATKEERDLCSELDLVLFEIEGAQHNLLFRTVDRVKRLLGVHTKYRADEESERRLVYSIRRICKGYFRDWYEYMTLYDLKLLLKMSDVVDNKITSKDELVEKYREVFFPDMVDRKIVTFNLSWPKIEFNTAYFRVTVNLEEFRIWYKPFDDFDYERALKNPSLFVSSAYGEFFIPEELPSNEIIEKTLESPLVAKLKKELTSEFNLEPQVFETVPVEVLLPFKRVDNDCLQVLKEHYKNNDFTLDDLDLLSNKEDIKLYFDIDVTKEAIIELERKKKDKLWELENFDRSW